MTTLQLKINTVEDEEIYRRLCDFPPALERLHVGINTSYGRLKSSCRHIAGRFLQASQSSLTRLGTFGKSYEMYKLFQVLPTGRYTNLSELFFWSPINEPDFTSSVRGIDFDTQIPSLETMRLHHENVCEDDEDHDDEERRNLAALTSSPSTTVTTLELELVPYRNENLIQLREAFPAVTYLPIMAQVLVKALVYIATYPDLATDHLYAVLGRSRRP